MDNTDKKALHKQRMYAALNNEKADKAPVVIMGPIPCAKYADRNIVAADAVERPEYFLDKAFDGLDLLKYVDSIQGFSSALSRTKGLTFMANTKLPGVEIERDAMIQIEEIPHMEKEEYSRLIEKGWGEYKKYYIDSFINVTPEDFEKSKRFKSYAVNKISESEYYEWSGGASPMPWDLLTAMRGMTTFFRDLRKDPEMIKQAMAAIDIEEGKMLDGGIKAFDPDKAFSIMVQPGVRSNCSFVSRKVFEEFVWPYVQKYADKLIDANIPVHFHYDSKWDDFLDLFTYFPKNKCIMDTDGMTDIYKVKEILGRRMAITGNVSASMLSLDTPEEVYAFTKKQLNDIGPEGYIICSSCTIPSNCKPENLQAMVEACQ